jgi:hypothetical protein
LSEEISLKDRKTFENTIKDLEAYSLLEENERVTKGFFPVFITGFSSLFQKASKCYGLLTQKTLILLRKIPFSKPDRLELIPFENIKELFYVKLRLIIQLLVGLGVFGIVALIFSMVHFMLKVGFPVDVLGIPIDIYLVVIGCLVAAVLSIFQIYEFIKGSGLIFIEIPGEKLSIHYAPVKGNFAVRHSLTVLESFGGELTVATKKAKLEDLYDMLHAAADCIGFKDLNIQYMIALFPPEKLQAKIHRRRSKAMFKNSDTESNT